MGAKANKIKFKLDTMGCAGTKPKQDSKKPEDKPAADKAADGHAAGDKKPDEHAAEHPAQAEGGDAAKHEGEQEK